jgi:hypothetical protein
LTKHVLAAVLAVYATSALAGGMTEPVAEPGVVGAETTSHTAEEHEKNGKNSDPLPIPVPIAALPDGDGASPASN